MIKASNIPNGYSSKLKQSNPGPFSNFGKPRSIGRGWRMKKTAYGLTSIKNQNQIIGENCLVKSEVGLGFYKFSCATSGNKRTSLSEKRLRHTRSGLLAVMPMSGEESDYEEVSMQQSFLFSDSLKDLKNLRTQLYSAAEYFELSYTNDDHKQIVVETLKDYAVKAIVNTVDHLGSVTYKVNDFLEEKVDEVSGTELRVSCVEERVRKCQQYIDHEGISQQSSVIKTPKYHKRYILPVGETLHGANQTKSKYRGCGLDGEGNCHRFRNAVRATIRETRLPPSSVKETPPSSIRRGRSPSPSPRPQQRSTTFSFTATTPKKGLEKRTGSPHRFPRLSFGSDSRPATPNKSRSSTPNSAGARQRYPSEPRKSAVMHLDSEKDNTRDIEQYPSKTEVLSRRVKSRLPLLEVGTARASCGQPAANVGSLLIHHSESATIVGSPWVHQETADKENNKK
ncbi:hypothetical protein HRI_005030200 [Hibiscus trionum]|uniref:Uncharacterized protein n=1 Tax=Hibiscus trionum TaxID=183268 RepID=A0A9W7JFJ2_HIBTR|nr:hypothetical protein HRI_005030200 [Hibiscus trionum]